MGPLTARLMLKEGAEREYDRLFTVPESDVARK